MERFFTAVRRVGFALGGGSGASSAELGGEGLGARGECPKERGGLRAVDSTAPEAAMNVDHEVNLLVEEIHRLGSKNADGKLSVKFGVLFRDDKCANLFEALVGTLKAAKRRKIVTYSGELLLQGVHDDVDIVLLQD
ncbi:costars family protein ABRACL isoform X1 [Trachypithecus francoisi]|uniref:costars family protein ABRACL isoform X1 n=1 Tax=Trachypithecus francoisi TaxID=54180 RepID=UPI00141B6237|nr:costars family protein ABRACL isoform X1 [Trachypithecus francoisi]